ncbi:DUF6440 family protein [Clostridium gasigenes]|uniref:DUF6440 family protein n=1 Tax=Clostridium gasigenes TaxID=94869 RepID=UPI001C0A95BD|nr:hypothetical protein [Clostridium gasigenes]MBU3134848.1 hypothetical protein [Clostridium gasigenes]
MYEEGNISCCKIIADTVTGINYLFANEGYAGGLTVLLDKDGKTVITGLQLTHFYLLKVLLATKWRLFQLY